MRLILLLASVLFFSMAAEEYGGHGGNGGEEHGEESTKNILKALKDQLKAEKEKDKVLPDYFRPDVTYWQQHPESILNKFGFMNFAYIPKEHNYEVTEYCGGESHYYQTHWHNEGYPNTNTLPGVCTLHLKPPEGTCAYRVEFEDLAFSPAFKMEDYVCPHGVPSFRISHAHGLSSAFCTDLTHHEGIIEVDESFSGHYVLMISDVHAPFKFEIKATAVPCIALNKYKPSAMCGMKNPGGFSSDMFTTYLSRSNLARKISPVEEDLQITRKSLLDILREKGDIYSRGLVHGLQRKIIKVDKTPVSPLGFLAETSEWPWVAKVEMSHSSSAATDHSTSTAATDHSSSSTTTDHSSSSTGTSYDHRRKPSQIGNNRRKNRRNNRRKNSNSSRMPRRRVPPSKRYSHSSVDHSADSTTTDHHSTVSTTDGHQSVDSTHDSSASATNTDNHLSGVETTDHSHSTSTDSSHSGHDSSADAHSSTLDCTGVLVDETHVMAPASCILRYTTDYQGHFQVTLGMEGTSHARAGHIMPSVPVSKVTLPLTYSPSAFKDDIAVLTLATPVPLSNMARPICLATSHDLFTGESGIVMGRQESDFVASSDALLYAPVTVTDGMMCNAEIYELANIISTVYPNNDANNINLHHLACAGVDSLDPFCALDHGSLLIRQGQTGVYYLTGMAAPISSCQIYPHQIYSSLTADSHFVQMALSREGELEIIHQLEEILAEEEKAAAEAAAAAAGGSHGK